MNEEIRKKLATPIEGYSWRMQQANNQKVGGKYPPGTRGLFMAYIDARDLYDRLDDVFGVGGWKRQIVAVNPDGSVTGRISVRISDPDIPSEYRWIDHEDIGYSNDPGAAHEKEPLKAAASDAFKRAGVGLGIGRFLYEMEPVWRDVDQWGKPLQPINPPSAQERSPFPSDDRPHDLGAPTNYGPTAVPVGQPTLAQKVRREAPVRHDKGDPQDQPCDVPGCDLTCAGKFVGYSQRSYGLNLCGKHSKRAKEGQLDLDQVRMDIANGHEDRQDAPGATNGSTPPQLFNQDASVAWSEFWRLVRPMGHANLQDLSRFLKAPLDGLADIPPAALYDRIMEAS